MKGHYCKYLDVDAQQMIKITQDKAKAEHKRLQPDKPFDVSTIDVSAIVEGTRYYRGWIFIPYTSIYMMSRNLLSRVSELDAASCSIGILFRHYTTDANHHPHL
jgi:hypothetical protein